MAVPLFLLNILNSLYNVIDTFWVGQIGELQVGAVSLVGPIMWCAQSVASGLSAAAIAIISTKLGAKQKMKLTVLRQPWYTLRLSLRLY